MEVQGYDMCYYPKLISARGIGRKESIYVPCGRCVECQKKNGQDWIFRLQQESKRNEFTLFITLTYDNENIPTMSDGTQCFDNHHISCYLSRVRTYMHRTYKMSFKYVITGEYGEQYQRPHYHGIVFIETLANIDPNDIIAKFQIEWKHGISEIDIPNSPNAVYSYVSHYIMKGNYSAIPKETEGTKTTKFRLHTSGNLGINYLRDPEASKYYHDPRNYSEVLVQGDNYNHLQQLPRYYRKKINPIEWTADEARKLRVNQEIAQAKRLEQLYTQYLRETHSMVDYNEWYNNVYTRIDEYARRNYQSLQKFLGKKKR